MRRRKVSRRVPDVRDVDSDELDMKGRPATVSCNTCSSRRVNGVEKKYSGSGFPA